MVKSEFCRNIDLSSVDLLSLQQKETLLNKPPKPNDPDQATEPLSPKFSRDSWFLLIFGVFWAGITGIFFSLLPAWVGLSGLAIAIVYAKLVCQLQQRAIWGATGMAVLVAIVYSTQDSSLSGYIIGMTLAINAWIFGTLGTTMLTLMSHQQAFIRLAGLFAGALGIGWAIALFSE